MSDDFDISTLLAMIGNRDEIQDDNNTEGDSDQLVETETQIAENKAENKADNVVSESKSDSTVGRVIPVFRYGLYNNTNIRPSDDDTNKIDANASDKDVYVLAHVINNTFINEKMMTIANEIAKNGCTTTGKKYYRILHGEDLRNNKWKVGYLIDSDSTDTMDEICPGRLFVYEEDQIPVFICEGNTLAVVEIPEIAEVQKGFRKINTNMLKVLEVMPLEYYEKWNDIEFCYSMIRKNSEFIRYMKNPTLSICVIAVQYNPENIQWIHTNNRNKYLYRSMVISSPLSLKNVPFDMIDEDMVFVAVKNNGLALQFVPEELKTRDICEMAVWVKDDKDMGEPYNKSQCFCSGECHCYKFRYEYCNPDKGHALKFIPLKFHDVDMYRKAKVLGEIVYKNLIDYEMCHRAIKLDGLELKYAPAEFMTDDLIELAVNKNAHALEFVPEEKQTSKLCMDALKKTVSALQFIKKQTQKQISYALSKDPEAWEYVHE